MGRCPLFPGPHHPSQCVSLQLEDGSEYKYTPPTHPHLTTLPGGLRIEEEGAAGQGDLPQDRPMSTVDMLPQSLATPQRLHPADL